LPTSKHTRRKKKEAGARTARDVYNERGEKYNHIPPWGKKKLQLELR